MVYLIAPHPNTWRLESGATYREDIANRIKYAYTLFASRGNFKEVAEYKSVYSKWERDGTPPPLDCAGQLLAREWLEREPHLSEELSGKERKRYDEAISMGDYITADKVIRKHIFPYVFAELTNTPPPEPPRGGLVRRFIRKLFHI